MEHTGVEPPPMLARPKIKAYGDVGLYENATLSSQIRHLYPGDGITSLRPLIMEEYGQQCVIASGFEYACIGDVNANSVKVL
jgi:hypothetical protein